jgi:hypothetical protein
VGARDRSIRSVFDTVVDSYVSGRPEMPIDESEPFELVDLVWVIAGRAVLA